MEEGAYDRRSAQGPRKVRAPAWRSSGAGPPDPAVPPTQRSTPRRHAGPTHQRLHDGVVGGIHVGVQGEGTLPLTVVSGIAFGSDDPVLRGTEREPHKGLPFVPKPPPTLQPRLMLPEDRGPKTWPTPSQQGWGVSCRSMRNGAPPSMVPHRMQNEGKTTLGLGWARPRTDTCRVLWGGCTDQCDQDGFDSSATRWLRVGSLLQTKAPRLSSRTWEKD